MKQTLTRKDTSSTSQDTGYHPHYRAPEEKKSFDVVQKDYQPDLHTDSNNPFLHASRIIIGKTHEIMDSILNLNIFSPAMPLAENLKPYMQAGAYIPGIDISRKTRAGSSSRISHDVEQHFQKTYRQILDHTQKHYSQDPVVSRQLAYVFTFYEAHGHTLQRYITSAEKKQAGETLQEARQAQQELHERQLSLERLLGMPHISVLLTQEFLTPGRREQLSKEYHQIREQTNFEQRFNTLTQFSEKLRREWNIYQITGTAMDMQRFTQNETAEQQITEHVKHVVQQSGWETLITHIAASSENDQIDENIQTHIRGTIGIGTDRAGIQPLTEMINDKDMSGEMRVLAITALRNMAQDTHQDEAICEEAQSPLSALSKNTTQDLSIRQKAIQALGTIGGKKAVENLGALLTSSQEPDIRKAASIGLCDIIRSPTQHPEVHQFATKMLLDSHTSLPGSPELINILHEIVRSKPQHDLHVKARNLLMDIALDQKHPWNARRPARSIITSMSIDFIKTEKELPMQGYLQLIDAVKTYGTVEQIADFEKTIKERKDLNGRPDISNDVLLKTTNNLNQKKEAFRKIAKDSLEGPRTRKTIVMNILLRTAKNKNISATNLMHTIDILSEYKHISVIQCLQAIYQEKQPEDPSQRMQWQARAGGRNKAKTVMLSVALDFAADESKNLLERKEALQSLNDYSLQEIAPLQDLVMNPGTNAGIRQDAVDTLCRAALKTLQNDATPFEINHALSILNTYYDNKLAPSRLIEFIHDATKDEGARVRAHSILRMRYNQSGLTESTQEAIDEILEKAESIGQAVDIIWAELGSQSPTR